MRLDDEEESANIVDRRGEGGGVGGGGFRLPIGGGRMGIGTLIIVGVLALVMGVNPLELLGAAGGGGVGGPDVGQPPVEGPAQPAALDGAHDRFIAKVLGSTERTWAAVFQDQVGEAYPAPKLVLFAGAVNSGCGPANSGMGPFYCPADRNVYLDSSFFDDLSRRFGAPGDFAAAYVIAHEVGHHIQTVLGISEQVQQARRRGSEAEGNALSVRQELQADCLAGVWAHHNRDLLEPGDIEEGLRAAEAIGDDTLQRQAGTRINPESFTHGTSQQRMRWLKAGLDSGRMDRCDTFAARNL
ncbi:KPN_02809 family neutral zinc metallopeptidase [Sandarakinorhabdus rubra]|uniref:KPN_02809 family neutral zinc metallopeptidase n=1 Tax=Sandarakinorhabdus rubra TaxID=2672568 RepID=UPI0013DCB8D7|nr:neutral zinc metallopeptidase [Sandarakinorhabdus rubra]